MARPRNATPSYLRHRTKARAVWTDANGVQRFRSLPGEYNSQESKKAFARLQLELETEPSAVESPRGRPIYVADVLDKYLKHAKRHYCGADGRPTSEADHVRTVAASVNELYGDQLAANFGPLSLKAVRHSFVKAGWSRRTVNQQTERVRRVFKWAASEELVPASVFHSLMTVAGLKKGRTAAPDPEPVAPVDDSTVDATLPHLGRHVRGLVEFQRLTGCRPGEACRLRVCDIDQTGEVWTYKPEHHKNSHRGTDRVIAIGPKCQAMLRDYFTDNPAEYLFSPRRAVEDLRAARAAARETPRYHSHMIRNREKRKVNPKRIPAECYTSRSYSAAVSRAIEKANAKAGKNKGKAAIPHWHPNQLRHSHGTRVRKEFGLEAAQVALGHSKADVTQVYAERNQALAAEVAAKIG